MACLAVLLCGCSAMPDKSASAGPAPVAATGGWQDVCYAGFAEDVDAVAGPQAVDCGFHVGPGASSRDIAQWQACGRKAVDSGRPFKLGYRSFGTDSAFCSVAIRTPEGELISWYLDFDVTGGGGTEPSSALWASRCTGMDFRPGSIGPGSFFRLTGCEELMSGRVWDIWQARVR
jgi:hypothetical protein